MEHSTERFERSHEPFIGSPSHGDERRSSRSDNWHGESEPRSGGTFSEGGRAAARRLYADRADRFWGNGFPYSMQGVYRTAPRKSRGAETRRSGREVRRKSNRKAWRQRTANRQLNRLKPFHYQSALRTRRASAPRAQMIATAPSTIGPTIQHPGPTRAMTDSVIPADKFKSKRRVISPSPSARSRPGGGWRSLKQERLAACLPNF
jgi:hypothetical protein